MIMNSYRNYEFKGDYKVNEILPFITKYKKDRLGNKNVKEYNNETIKMFSLRYLVFNKSCECVVCGRQGTHFKMQRDKGSKGSYHFGLWSDDNVQLTKDHIIPKSKGGKDNLDNLVTMCEICNSIKSNYDTIEEGFKHTNIETFAKSLKIRYSKELKRINDYQKENKVNPFKLKVIEDKSLLKDVTIITNITKQIINHYGKYKKGSLKRALIKLPIINNLQ